MRSFSIDQFCELHSISRNYFYQLENKGEAPKTFPLGRHRRISEESNAAWIASREAMQDAARADCKAIGRAAVRARKDRLAVQP
jgi:excisionase family DNA binding protein